MRRGIEKEKLAAWAAGPAVVRRMAPLPMVGPLARDAWRRWFDWKLDGFYRARNAAAAAAFRANVPQLDTVQQGVLADLRRDGIAMVPADALLGRDRMLPLHRDVEAWLASPDVQAKERGYREQRLDGNEKAYLVRMLGRGGALAWSSPWLRLASEPRILDVVNSYLALHARLHYVDVWNTLPLEREGPDVGSQRWHRDPEAPRLVKVFIYFTDVDADSGPLMIVPASRPGQRYGRLWPQEFPGGSQPPADLLERRIPPSEWVVCTVPAGTMVFADTAALHRGGRARTSRRVLSVAAYVPPASVWPRTFEVDGGSIPRGVPPSVHDALLSPDV